MKKENFSLYISKQEDNQLEVENLRKDLETMEQLFPVFTPDLHWFAQQVEESKRAAKRKFVKELIVFWLVAILLIMLTLFMFYRIPLMYIALQIIGVLGIVFANAFFNKRKRVNRQ